MKSKEANRWQKIRTRGMLKFVLVDGTLKWGVTMFLAMTLFNIIRKGLEPINLTLMRLAISTSMGAVWGILTWCLSERLYNKQEKEKQLLQ